MAPGITEAHIIKYNQNKVIKASIPVQDFLFFYLCCSNFKWLKILSFLENYYRDISVQTLVAGLQTTNGDNYWLRGLKGSLDAVIAAAVSKLVPASQLFILEDREQAAYFQNDLQSLTQEEVLLYPTSYKRPYQYEEVENANVLMRAEILNRVVQSDGEVLRIVTYPEALAEKVINKKSLISHTLMLKVGANQQQNALNDQLQDYGFEKTDFVYEAGQFSIRGGILDIFSYANELPFRLEFFGSEIESIRTFDPITQLSVDQLQKISIIPNVETTLRTETRQSFFDFLLPETNIWIKDLEHLFGICEEVFKKASAIYQEQLALSKGTGVISEPTLLFEDLSINTEKY